ncbi:putative N-acetylgalactosamine kinase [Blattamonas nauphoetae]|uniref:N-acetylgalactosamine kinase n=1 Tax=Blattamonas nauphoetae TaxID=2049346 RepID=A0ABQ9YML9_9EUKA|nr:putative N-acetylgalactosamine kinase [Blattamonas nauphoetae]
MNYNELKDLFLSTFGQSTETLHCYNTPGRVNLIGEHTDYNGGYVFPCGIEASTKAVARRRSDSHVTLKSTNFPETISFELGNMKKGDKHEWYNYCLGCFWVVTEQFGVEKIGGIEILYSGTIPIGAGLSSSASLEVLTLFILNETFKLGMTRPEIAVGGQKAENQYVGMNCGIMDQFAVANARKNEALKLDCATLQFESIPVDLGKYKLLIGNTNKPHNLIVSKYNDRRSECEQAVTLLQKEIKINNLCELSMEQFNKHSHLIQDPVVLKRAKHAISENERVLEACRQLKAGNLAEFGRLMDASHESLKTDYEVTGHELDSMVDAIRHAAHTLSKDGKEDIVLGCRMTGGGFGGCTVGIVLESAIQSVIDLAGEEYKRLTNLTPEFYVVSISEGASCVE